MNTSINVGKRLKASTIVESIVALLVLSISVGMGMMVYLNIMRSTRSEIKREAKVMVDQLVDQTKAKESWIDEEIEGGHFRISKSIVKYKSYNDIYILNVKAVDSRKVTLYNHNELIYSN
jgi:hypothetical protein